MHRIALKYLHYMSIVLKFNNLGSLYSIAHKKGSYQDFKRITHYLTKAHLPLIFAEILKGVFSVCAHLTHFICLQ